MVWVYLKLPGKIKECTVNIYCIKWYLLECLKQDVSGNICSRHVKGGGREVRGQWCGVRMIPGEEEQIVKTHSPRKERKWANGWWVHIVARIHTHTNTDTHTHTHRKIQVTLIRSSSPQWHRRCSGNIGNLREPHPHLSPLLGKKHLFFFFLFPRQSQSTNIYWNHRVGMRWAEDGGDDPDSVIKWVHGSSWVS